MTLNFTRPHKKVQHPVLGEKLVQDGKFFFLDGSPCHADPSGKGTRAPSAPPSETPPQETRTVIGRIDPAPDLAVTEAPAFNGSLMTPEQLQEMTWPAMVKACKDTGLVKVPNKQAAIQWLTTGTLPA